MFGECGCVDQTSGFANGLCFGNCVFPPCATAEATAVVVKRRRRINRAVVVRAFPAVHLAELRAEFLLAVVNWRGAQWTCSFAFFVWVVQNKDVLVAFFVLFHRVIGGHPRSVAFRVERRHVDLGFAVYHHLSEVVARAARSSDTEGETFSQPHVAQTRSWTNERGAIRRVADRAVEVVLETNSLRGRNTVNHRHVFFFDPLEVEREEVRTEAIRNAVLETCRCAALIRAEDPAAALFADIPFRVSVTQNWVLCATVCAVFNQRRIGFGHDELVLNRDGRDFDAQEFRSALCVVTRCGHNVVRVDHCGFFGRNEVAAALTHFGDSDFPVVASPFVAVDLPFAFDDHTALTRTLCHRHGDISRVDVAVLRVEQCALEVVGAHQRPALFDLVRGEEFVVNVCGFRNRRIEHVFVHALLGLRHTQVAADREASVQARFRLKRFVEIDRVFVDVGRRKGHVEQRQKTGSVPCRA